MSITRDITGIINIFYISCCDYYSYDYTEALQNSEVMRWTPRLRAEKMLLAK